MGETNSFEAGAHVELGSAIPTDTRAPSSTGRRASYGS